MTKRSLRKWIFHAAGASNTAGYGGTFALDKVIRYVLEVHSVKNKTLVNEFFKGKRVQFLLDYFYPTRFPYYEKKYLPEINSIIDEHISEYLEVCDLIFIASLPRTETMKKYVSNIENSHIKQIVSGVEENERNKVRDAINNKIAEVAFKNPKVQVINLSRWFAMLCDVNFTYKINPVEHWKINQFFSENKHFNDFGQFLAVNEFIIPELEKYVETVHESKISFQKYSMAHLLAPHWRNRILKGLFATELNKSGGHYFVTIENAQSIWKGGDLFDNHTKDNFAMENFLKYKSIQALNIFFFMTAKKTAELEISKDQNNLILDLTKILTFVPVKMWKIPDEEDAYEGYGYDFWTSIGNEITNYRFKAQLERKKKLIHITWEIFPRLPEQQVKYTRRGYIEEKWINYLKENESKIDRLKYMFSLRIQTQL